MALMVKDTYELKDDHIFREGMRKLDDASKDKNGVGFMKASPQQRLALLQDLDREQFNLSEQRKAEAKRKSDEFLSERQQNMPTPTTTTATQITEQPPKGYFRMMKELALLGYFTSEIGMTQAQRYNESPGRYDPCVDYKPGQPAWAGHA